MADTLAPEAAGETPANSKALLKKAEAATLKFNYKRFFVSTPDYNAHNALLDVAIKNNVGLRKSQCRSLCWMVFLGVLDKQETDLKSWGKQIDTHRRNYEALKKKHIVDPREHQEADKLFDPLGVSEDNPWDKYFENERLQRLISQDIDRTFPEMPFFQDQKTKDLMLNVLFIYSKEHEDTSYKQGMHELLAPIILARNNETVNEDLGDGFYHILGPEYMEHDIFALFCGLMNEMHKYFVVYADDKKTDNVKQTPILKKLIHIQRNLLLKHDPQLYNFIESLDIEPQIYALRWVRLLFMREFHIEDCMVIWDGIFAHGNGFILLDYISLAMLMYLREQLLASDHNGCLRRLLKYPPVESPHAFVTRGINLLSGKRMPMRTDLTAAWTPVPTELSGHHVLAPSHQQPQQTRHAQKRQPQARTQPRAQPQQKKPKKTQPADGRPLQPVKKGGNNNVRQSGFKSSVRNALKNAMYQDDLELVVRKMQSNVNDMKNLQGRISVRLSAIAGCLQRDILGEPELASRLPDNVFLAIAELKRIKDVLGGLLPQEMLTTENLSYEDSTATTIQDSAKAISNSQDTTPETTPPAATSDSEEKPSVEVVVPPAEVSAPNPQVEVEEPETESLDPLGVESGPL